MARLSRVVVWGCFAGAVAAGVAAGRPPAADAPDPIRKADPLGAMLADAKTAYARVRDYTCVFTRQERVGGVLSAEQVAEMKVRTKPYSVAVRFARPDAVAGREESFVAGSRLGKMRLRPAAGKLPVLVALDDPKVTAEARHPLTEYGIGPVIDLLAAAAAREKVLGNPVEAYAADYQFAGRNVTRYDVFARRPHAHRYAYRTLVYVDKETGLPVRFEAYDAPKPTAAAGDLLEAYSFTDVKLNAGLGDSAFE